MSGRVAPAPPARQVYYGYIAIDKRTGEPVELYLKRRQLREAVQFREDADHLKIRRVSIIPFEG